MMIDTHCHLDIADYENVEEVIKHMDGNIMIASGCNLETSKRVIELVNKYDNIYGTIGIHPSEVQDMNEDVLNYIFENAKNSKIVGIGEIGLDYHYGKEDRDLQIEYFLKQIELAKMLNKVIVIHSRDAQEDTLEILKNNLGNLKAVLHCYGYSYEASKEFKKLGVKFGIGGVLTFKNGVKLKEVVEKNDLDDFVLETDSPYLAPEPFRGQKNEPYNVLYVAKEIARIKNITLEEVLENTTKTAINLFDLK